MQILGEENLGS